MVLVTAGTGVAGKGERQSRGTPQKGARRVKGGERLGCLWRGRLHAEHLGTLSWRQRCWGLGQLSLGTFSAALGLCLTRPSQLQSQAWLRLSHAP